jgi:hypothetical protein
MESESEQGEMELPFFDDEYKNFQDWCSIETTYNTAVKKIDEKNIIAVGISAAMIDYQEILMAEQRHLGSNLKLSVLVSAMNKQWRQTMLKQESKSLL